MNEDDQQHWVSRRIAFYRKKTVGKKNKFHCFCCCNPAISHRMMDRRERTIKYITDAIPQ